MMKFRVLSVVVLLYAVAVLSADEEAKLYIYNWLYYCPESIIEKFEKEYPIDIIYDTFYSNEDMYTTIRAGETGYDLVFPTADYISIMIAQGMLEKIDKSRLSNLGNIDPKILEKVSFDPQMDYHVPYYYGAAGVAVNTLRVPNYEESWSIFARPDLANRMTMLDDPREVLGAALLSLGHSVNSLARDEIMEAGDLVKNRWAPNLTCFDSGAFPKAYAADESWVVQCYFETILQEISGNSELKTNTVFFIPQEGGSAYLDGMCILKGAKHIDAAHKFIDFIHRPEIYAEFTDYYNYPSAVNIPARSLKKKPPFIAEEDMLRTELLHDVGGSLDYYNEAWLFDQYR
jgi:spermidine/putrescine transport system substrate-binding protein